MTAGKWSQRPGGPREDEHWHGCPVCLFVWAHANMPPLLHAMDEAHTCSKCQSGPFDLEFPNRAEAKRHAMELQKHNRAIANSQDPELNDELPPI